MNCEPENALHLLRQVYREKLLTVHAPTSNGRKAWIVAMSDELAQVLRDWKRACGREKPQRPRRYRWRWRAAGRIRRSSS